MQCPSCNSFRPANNAPCPVCFASAPLGGDAQGGSGPSFSARTRRGSSGPNSQWVNTSGKMSVSTSFWQEPPDVAGPQLPFPDAPQTGSLWMQVMSPSSEQTSAPSPGQSLVPYQSQDQGQPALGSLMVLPTAFPTLNTDAQSANPLLPALPDSGEGPTYVAPMYTKPRPIIPRYRAISGLLSIIIVFSLLCAGSVYWAQATGKLVFFQKLMGNYTPPKVASAQGALTVPSMQITAGPASTIIPSAALGTTIDPASNQIPVFVNQFTVGQTIYLSCSVNSPTAGKVLTKWYTNGNYYRSYPSKVVAANVSQTAAFPITYALPSEGKVEIYWTDVNGNNPQLAVTLLFVVEPAP